MTKKQAQEQGLHFTGIYNRDKEETQKRIAEARIKYPKARIVLVPERANPLSRGQNTGIVGYSAYADYIYSAYEQVHNASKIIDSYQTNYDFYKKQFDEKIKELDERKLAAETRLNEANEILNKK